MTALLILKRIMCFFSRHYFYGSYSTACARCGLQKPGNASYLGWKELR